MAANAMLSVRNLHVRADGKDILCGVNLEIGAGEVHAVMGPNGSGKSTLAHVLAGRDDYEVTRGRIDLNGENLLAMSIEERAGAGVFLGFQYPVAIPGVSTMYLLKSALNAQRRRRGQSPVDAIEFLRLVKEQLQLLDMREDMLQRAVNQDFSGGEKKRNEILQMAVLQPSLAVLDEIDSGLDIDALRLIAEGIGALRTPQRSFLLITHYQRLLHHVTPDRVHVMAAGKLVKSGSHKLALELEQRGYDWLTREVA